MSGDHELDILFVDDDPRILDGLRRQFRADRATWSMRFTTSGDDALHLLEEQAADVVICDMRMPGLSGAELLREVRRRWPGTVRFVLSGQTDQTELLKDIGAIHQFMQKPCTPESLRRAVHRSTELAARVESPELRALAASVRSLPVVSEVYLRLVEVLQDESSDAEAISAVVESDVGLSTKLLQMVNSAFFGLPREVRSVHQAVVLIGTLSIRQIALTSQIFDALGADDLSSAMVTRLWRASADIGTLAAKLARDDAQPPNVCDAARLAGTLCLVGRAIVAHWAPARYEKVLDKARTFGCGLCDAEAAEFGAPQHEVGAYALGLWAFGNDVVEAVARQESPQRSAIETRDHALTYVHLARSRIAHGPLAEKIEPASEWLESLLPPAGAHAERDSA